MKPFFDLMKSWRDGYLRKNAEIYGKLIKQGIYLYHPFNRAQGE